MKYYADKTIIDHSNYTFMFIISCILLLAILLFSSGCDRDVSPPNLSNCTHIEIRYPRSTLNYFLPSSDLQDSVLSKDEKEYIQSFDFFTIKNPESIKAFNHDVSLGSYNGRLWGRIFDGDPIVAVKCYRNDDHVASFTLCGNLIITENKHVFKYAKGLPDLKTIDPVEMLPFKLRFQCGLNMQRIYTAGPLDHKRVSSYPEPTEWCDAVMLDRINISYFSEDKMMECFMCPSVGEGRCHYAINPHCKPSSPWDTVLLFETKVGWNQHGGPELFTFDNHAPKGGCVLLNDGTVKFIRTEGELHRLRWK